MRRIDLPGNLTVFGINPDETRFMHGEVFGERCYLRHGLELRDGDCVFDVGANIGMASLFFHRERKNIRIFAFEPNPVACECLRANLELYRVNAQVFACGLLSTPGKAEFTLYPANTVISGFHANPKRDRAITRAYMINSGFALDRADRFVEMLFSKEEKFSCAISTISHVIDEYRVETIDLLKIDVERSEREVLLGIREEHWDRIQQVTMEIADEDCELKRIQRMLADRGFRVKAEQDPLLRGTAVYSLFAARTSMD